jgi:hypothetical protein
MRPGITVDVTAADRARLEAVMADRNSPQKHAYRAAIVLATADGLGTNSIMRRTGKSKTAVWRWQGRFGSEGADGLMRDKKVRMASCATRRAVGRRAVRARGGRRHHRAHIGGATGRDDALDRAMAKAA